MIISIMVLRIILYLQILLFHRKSPIKSFCFLEDQLKVLDRIYNTQLLDQNMNQVNVLNETVMEVEAIMLRDSWSLFTCNLVTPTHPLPYDHFVFLKSKTFCSCCSGWLKGQLRDLVTEEYPLPYLKI